MNIKIQVFVALFIILALVIIINMIRKKSLELRYALAWLLVGISIFILDMFPQLITWMANIVGIGVPVNILFFLGFCFFLGIIFILTIAVSRMSIKVKNLAQELALFEKESKNNEENERKTIDQELTKR